MEGNNFRAGNEVKHLKTGTIMTIKKNYGAISSCYRDKKDIEVINKRFIIDIYVCQNDNLILLNHSPTQCVLF